MPNSPSSLIVQFAQSAIISSYPVLRQFFYKYAEYDFSAACQLPAVHLHAGKSSIGTSAAVLIPTLKYSPRRVYIYILVNRTRFLLGPACPSQLLPFFSNASRILSFTRLYNPTVSKRVTPHNSLGHPKTYGYSHLAVPVPSIFATSTGPYCHHQP